MPASRPPRCRLEARGCTLACAYSLFASAAGAAGAAGAGGALCGSPAFAQPCAALPDLVYGRQGAGARSCAPYAVQAQVLAAAFLPAGQCSAACSAPARTLLHARLPLLQAPQASADAGGCSLCASVDAVAQCSRRLRSRQPPVPACRVKQPAVA